LTAHTHTHTGPPRCRDGLEHAPGVEGNRWSFFALYNEDPGTPAPPTPPTSPPAGAVPIAQLGSPLLVPRGAFWHFTTNLPFGNYRARGFDVSSWTRMRAPFWYGESSLMGMGSRFVENQLDQWYRTTFTLTQQQFNQLAAGRIRYFYFDCYVDSTPIVFV